MGGLVAVKGHPFCWKTEGLDPKNKRKSRKSGNGS